MNEIAKEAQDERMELHFLAAMVDELMRALLSSGTLRREQLQEIEDAVSVRTGTPSRGW